MRRRTEDNAFTDGGTTLTAFLLRIAQWLLDNMTPDVMMNRVRPLNLSLCLFDFKCCVSRLSVDRFGIKNGGLMTLGQVKSSPNFCSFGPQRAKKCII